MSTLLPELPEPFTYPTGDIPHVCVCGSWPGGECLRCTAINFFTADQVRAIQLEAWKAAIEAAKQACLEERVDAEGSGAREDFAYNNAISHCIDAMDALPSPE